MFGHHDSQTVGEFSITTVVNTPPWHENCYVVLHRPSGRRLVIDPGGEAERIGGVVQANGKDIPEILLTHGHPDHLGGVHDLQVRFDAPCRAHRAEEPIITGAAAWAAALMERRIKSPRTVEYFDGEPVLSFGAFSARVLLTPGHTPGGVCFLFEGFAFTGDTLFNQGVGRTDFPGGSRRQLSASITRLLAEVDDSVILFSGHGPAWTAGAAKPWWEFARTHGYV